jgi:hypothetical protein
MKLVLHLEALVICSALGKYATMSFNITITAEAESHLRALPVRDQRTLEMAILTRLTQDPTKPTRAIND